MSYKMPDNVRTLSKEITASTMLIAAAVIVVLVLIVGAFRPGGGFVLTVLGALVLVIADYIRAIGSEPPGMKDQVDLNRF